MPFVKFIANDVSVSDNYAYCVKKLSKDAVRQSLKAKEAAVKDADEIGRGIAKSSDVEIERMNAQATQSVGFLGTITARVRDSEHVMEYVTAKVSAFFQKVGAFIMVLYYVLLNYLSYAQLVALFPFQIYVGVLSMIVVSLMTMITLPLAASVTTAILVLGTSLLAFLIALRKAAEARSYCCFAPQTQIALEDGKLAYIRDVEPGQLLRDGNVVFGVLRVLKHARDDLRTFKGIHVTADHAFASAPESPRLRIRDLSRRHAPVSEIEIDMVWCLVTKSNTIHVYAPEDDTFVAFADYEESRADARHIASDVAKHLGIPDEDIVYSNMRMCDDGGEANNVLACDAQVVLESGAVRDPSELRIGTALWSNSPDNARNTVVGIFEADSLDRREEAPTMVSYKGVPMTARQVVYVNGSWRKACCVASPSPRIVERSATRTNYYHVLTSSGMLWITSKDSDHRVLVRDFREVLIEI